MQLHYKVETETIIHGNGNRWSSYRWANERPSWPRS